MRMRGDVSKPLIIPITLAVGALLVGMGMVASAVQSAEPTKKIEIVAKDKEWKVSGYTLTDAPTEIVVRNEDTTTHGFNSSLFKDVKVTVSGDGYLAKEKGTAYRVDPGKTMTLKFSKAETGSGDSPTYGFWCDLHPNMRGEMFVLSLKGPGGG